MFWIPNKVCTNMLSFDIETAIRTAYPYKYRICSRSTYSFFWILDTMWPSRWILQPCKLRDRSKPFRYNTYTDLSVLVQLMQVLFRCKTIRNHIITVDEEVLLKGTSRRGSRKGSESHCPIKTLFRSKERRGVRVQAKKTDHFQHCQVILSPL